MSLMLFARSVSVVFLGGGVVDPDLLLNRLRSSTKSTTFPCETFTIAS